MTDEFSWSVGQRDRLLQEVVAKFVNGEYPDIMSD